MQNDINSLTTEAPGSGDTAWRYLSAVLLLPLIILWRQDNILFPPLGFGSPWEYFGFFRNLVEFKRTFAGSVIGDRLSWVLPGAMIYKLLPPLAANYALHLGLHTIASVCLFLPLKWLVGVRRAFLVTMLFSVNPFVCAATGWDEVDGISLVYCLLTLTLLTWAALSPHRRWPILLAGMSFAAIVYCNSDWMVLALMPLSYVGLMQSWHKTPFTRAFFVLCRWFGAGCLILTLALCAINKYLSGSFLALGFPVLNLLHRNPRSAPWWSGLWLDGAPIPWVLLVLVAVGAAGTILFSEWRTVGRPMTPAMVFSLQLCAASAWAAWAQLRGFALFASSYDTNILLPLCFLVIGVRFWPELESLSLRSYLSFCCLAAIVLGYAWLAQGMIWIGNPPFPAWIACGALAASLVWPQFPENRVWALGGFFLLTAMGVSLTYGNDTPPHAFREQFLVVLQARARVESVRQGQPVRFWYDQHDLALQPASALRSSYPWPDSLLSQSFQRVPCDRNLAPSTIIATLAADQSHGAEFVSSAFSGCWSGKGLRAAPVETDTFHQGPLNLELSLLRVEAIPGGRTAMRPAALANPARGLTSSGRASDRQDENTACTEAGGPSIGRPPAAPQLTFLLERSWSRRTADP